jgi:hypothetical protein
MFIVAILAPAYLSSGSGNGISQSIGGVDGTVTFSGGVSRLPPGPTMPSGITVSVSATLNAMRGCICIVKDTDIASPIIWFGFVDTKLKETG